MTLKELKAGLLAHYSAPPQQVLRQFRNGALCFAAGLITVFMANAQLPPSLAQELAVLTGLILVAVGFLQAMLAEVRFVIGRIIVFLRKP